MNPPVVSVKSVSGYEEAQVLSAMRACLEPLGGLRSVVKPGQRVLLKPNLIGAFVPERAATTHPAVLRAAILLAQEAGTRVFVGDSPGMGTLARAAHVSGYDPVLQETGAQLLDFASAHEFEALDNIVARHLTLAKALLDIDVLITLPKLKTHSQMTMTGALKNQYGLIPGSLKSQWHFRLQQPEWLASLILDINRVSRPALAIMDAIVAMEGPGPSGGDPRFVGALLAGRDLAAVDTMACELIGLNPARVPVLAAARKRRFGETNLEAIQIEGDDWRALRVPDFKNVKQLVDVIQMLPMPEKGLRWIRRVWTARPRIIADKCTKCGFCEKGCPVSPSAIRPQLGIPEQIDDARCISCYCCHEFCPTQAIELQQPWLARQLPMTAMADVSARLLGFLSSLSGPKGKK